MGTRGRLLWKFGCRKVAVLARTDSGRLVWARSASILPGSGTVALAGERSVHEVGRSDPAAWIVDGTRRGPGRTSGALAEFGGDNLVCANRAETPASAG